MNPTPADLQDLRRNLARIYNPEHPHHVRRFNCIDAWLASQAAQAAVAQLEFRLVDSAIEVVQGDGHRKRYTHPPSGMRAAQAAIARGAPVLVSEFVRGACANDNLRNSIRAAEKRLRRDGFDLHAEALGKERMRVEGGCVVYDPPANAPRFST